MKKCNHDVGNTRQHIVPTGIFLSHISIANEHGVNAFLQENVLRKIPKNISRMRQTKAETVKHVHLFCCLLDHLIANYLNMRLTRADARRAFFCGGLGCERGSAIQLWNAKTECVFHLFAIFSLFPSLGDVPESWRIAQKLCPGNLGDQQEGTCTMFFCRTYVHNGPESTIHIKNYWVYLELLVSIDVLLSLTCVSVSMYVLVLATFEVS